MTDIEKLITDNLSKEEILSILSDIDIESFGGPTFSDLVTPEYLNQCNHK